MIEPFVGDLPGEWGAGAGDNITGGGYDLEEPPGNTSGDAVTLVNYVINVYIDSLLCLLGFVGNTLIIHILRTDRKKTSNSLFLLVLAVYDNLILVFTVLYTILRSIYPATGALEDYYKRVSPYIIAYVLPVGWIAQTGCIWFTAFAAGDRYFAINFPLKAAQFCTIKRATRISAGASVAAILFNFPRFLHYQLVAFYSNGTDGTFVAHVRVELPEWDSQAYHYTYHIALTFIFLYIIPLGSIIFFNAKLIATLRGANKFRSQMSNNKIKNISNQVTLNLVVMITKFIVCQTPDFIAAILGAVPGIKTSDWFRIFSIIKEMLIVLNSSVNCYIYVVFNKSFRARFIEILTCRACRKKVPGVESSYYITSAALATRNITRAGKPSDGTTTNVTGAQDVEINEQQTPVFLKSYSRHEWEFFSVIDRDK